jgi:hypothetical protein
MRSRLGFLRYVPLVAGAAIIIWSAVLMGCGNPKKQEAAEHAARGDSILPAGDRSFGSIKLAQYEYERAFALDVKWYVPSYRKIAGI